MKYRSIFDVIGPVMIGPSSSHTAGAVRLGQLARKILGHEPTSIAVHFYGSFAETYKGHATDVAVIGGLLAFETDDERIPNAIAIAKEKGIALEFFKEEAVPEHPNTLKIVLKVAGDEMAMTGISIGGGVVQVTELNGFPLQLTGENPVILVLHQDAYGTVASVATVFANHKINIGHMEVSRMEKGQNALMVIESDQEMPAELMEEISAQQHVIKAIVIDTLRGLLPDV